MLEKFKKIFRFDDKVLPPASTSMDGPRLPKEVKEIRVIEGIARGSSGTAIYSGYFDEEYLHTLKGKDAADIWDKMRRSDARVKMCLSAVKNPIKGACWEVQCEEESEETKKHSEFIKHVLFCDLDKPWKEKVGEFLTFLDFGYSLFEIVHKVVENDPKWGTYNGIAQLGFRSQRTIDTWILDKNGKLLGVNQLAYGDLERQILLEGQNLLVFSLEKEGDNYEGVSGLRACYGAWYRKQLYLKLMGIGIERNAVPTPKVEYPEEKASSAAHEALKDHLAALTSHQKNYIMYPSGYKVDFAQNEFTTDEVKGAIQFENEEMTYAFLANFLLLGTGQNSGGSYALSMDLSDFFLGGVEHLADLICEGVNKHIIPSLIKMNFGPQAVYPKLRVTGISDKAGKEFGELLKMLVDGKIIIPDDVLEANIRKRLGLPEKSEEGQRETVNPLNPTNGGDEDDLSEDDKMSKKDKMPEDDEQDDEKSEEKMKKKLSEMNRSLYGG